MNVWLYKSGGMADIFGRLNKTEWEGEKTTPFPDDQLVPDSSPFYFEESNVKVTNWREAVWAKATGSITKS